MPAYVKDAGVWKPTVGSPWVRDAGIWKPAQVDGHYNDAGIWKPVSGKPSILYVSQNYDGAVGASSKTFTGQYLGPRGETRKFLIWAWFFAGGYRTIDNVQISGVGGTKIAGVSTLLTQNGHLWEVAVTPGSALDLLEYGDITVTCSGTVTGVQIFVMPVYNAFGALYDSKQVATTGNSTTLTFDINLDQDGYFIAVVRNNSNVLASFTAGFEAEQVLMSMNYNIMSWQINPVNRTPRTFTATYPASAAISMMVGGSWYRNP